MDKQQFEAWLEERINHYAARIAEANDRGDLSAAGELVIYMAVRGAVKNPDFRPGSDPGGGGMFEHGMLDAINDITVQLGMNATRDKFWKV